MAGVLDFKNRIQNQILKWPDITLLPPFEFTERKKLQLIEIIRAEAPRCFKDYGMACNVATLCYASLLLEQDEVGKKTRREFTEPQRRNVFGDTVLIQNTLWLKSRILSFDAALKRMAEYIAMPEIIVAACV